MRWKVKGTVERREVVRITKRALLAAWGVDILEVQWWNVGRGEQLHLLSEAPERVKFL